MSEAIAFNTLRFVKKLMSSGFTEAQAEALADEQAHLLNSNLATRADIGAVKADIRTARAGLLMWMVGALTAHAALIAGVGAGMIRFL